MEAIVLAGGLGTRLRSVVPDLPKPMASVAGRPFLEILLRKLARDGFGHVILSVGYMADKISVHFGNSFEGIEISYSVEEEPLGTGGAVLQAMGMVRGDHAFIFNGDTYLDCEVGALEALWQRVRTPIVVARHVDDTSRYGRLETRDGLVVRFAEKDLPGPGLINAGCYVFPAGLLNGLPAATRFSLEADYLAKAVEREPVALHVVDGMFIDIGVPEDYARAQTLFADMS